MYCTNCGLEIEKNMKFCPGCGTVIAQTTATAPRTVESVGSEIKSVNAPNNASLSYSQTYGDMSAQATSVVAYMTWIGFIVAVCAGDKEGAKFFINQALVFHLAGFLCFIPILGFFWAIFMIICFILGVIWAAEQTPRKLPLIGGITILN